MGMATAERDLTGRVVVITGASTGIGEATAVELARRGATTVLACRSEERTAHVLESIRVPGGSASFVQLDLADFASIHEGARRILALTGRLDVLLNNAGLSPARGSITQDGFETAFGVNHLGHFLLTVLLMPRLITTGHARVVNVSSQAHYQASGIDFDAVRRPTRSITGVPEYEVSKLANVLFTRELGRRVGPIGVHTYALHPGVVASDAWRRIPWPVRPLMKLRMISNAEGARTSVYCATSPDVAHDNGRYYDECKEKPPSPVADRAELARELWDKSVLFTGADLDHRA
jgi:retinol dehydrogenase-12